MLKYLDYKEQYISTKLGLLAILPSVKLTLKNQILLQGHITPDKSNIIDIPKNAVNNPWY